MSLVPQMSAAQPAGMMPSPAVETKQDIAIYIKRFWTRYDKTPGGEDWVTWVKIGQGGSETSEAIKRMKPRPELGRRAAVEWAVVGPAYEAWLQNKEAPVQGTPLEAWGASTPELVEELHKHHIRSVEDLAKFPDHRLGDIRISDMRALKNKASAYLAAQDASDVGAELAKRDETIAAQATELDDLRKEMADMRNAISTLNRQQGGVVQGDVVPAMKGPDPSDPDADVVDVNIAANPNVRPSPPPARRGPPGRTPKDTA